MELDRAEKPLRQMRKLLKQFPAKPAPDEVHRLRTRARKIEAIAATLEPAASKETKRLLRSIKPVRKAAGGVRDMDVLAGDLLHMPHDGKDHGDSLLRLIEHLSSTRSRKADDLVDAVDRQRKVARRCLKDYSQRMQSVASGKKPARIEVVQMLESRDGRNSLAADLTDELCRWPRLTARNLHPFRLKVKELRYVLQLFPDADPHFVESLGKVKDEIGDWHDWQQLHEIAGEVLNAQEDKALLAQIASIEKSRLAQALAHANALRGKYLPAAPAHRKAS